MPIDRSTQETDEDVFNASRGFGGRYPYAKNSRPVLQVPSPSPRHLEIEELDDTYVLFFDMPGERELWPWQSIYGVLLFGKCAL